MNKFIRALIAAWGAKKIGGGCLGTIVAFFVIYYFLGTCNSHPTSQIMPQKNLKVSSVILTKAKVYPLQRKIVGWN